LPYHSREPPAIIRLPRIVIVFGTDKSELILNVALNFLDNELLYISCSDKEGIETLDLYFPEFNGQNYIIKKL